MTEIVASLIVGMIVGIMFTAMAFVGSTQEKQIQALKCAETNTVENCYDLLVEVD